MDQSLDVRIGRYLSGEMTEQEKAQFEQEMAAAPGGQEHMSVNQRIWGAVPTSGDADEWDTEAALRKVRDRVEQQDKGNKRFSIRMMASAAAAVLVLFGLYMLMQRTTGTDHFAYDPSTTTPVVLADGSRVYLNEGSDIIVHRFSRHHRKVELIGEAYFEVSPDPGRPFLVIAGGTVTEVVGTAFNIRQSGRQTTILVSSGKVIFATEKDRKNAVALTAGESAAFEDNRIHLIPNPSPNIHAWRTRQLVFKNMPLADVLRDVSVYFGQEVKIENPDISTCRISMARPFVQPDIQPLLKAIALSINATLDKEGDMYIIRGGDCPDN